jgi:transposase
MATSESAIDEAVRDIAVDPKEIQAAIEPVSGWGWYGDQLEARGFAVRLVDVYKSKLIAGTKLKNDKVDSKILADMMRSDFLPEAYRAPKETRDMREFMRSRAFLVRLRVRIRNRIHMMLQKHGILCPWTDLFGKSGLLWLKEQKLGDVYKRELESLLALFGEISLHVRERDARCARLVAQSKEAKTLMTIPGIGVVTALTMLAEIGDYGRFPSPEKLASFAGLVSSSNSSGEKLRFGHITHRGSVWLRTALVESTGKVSEKWGYLHDFYWSLREKKGNKIARVALARKMLVLSWHLIRKNQRFNPRRTDSVKTGIPELS